MTFEERILADFEKGKSQFGTYVVQDQGPEQVMQRPEAAELAELGASRLAGFLDKLATEVEHGEYVVRWIYEILEPQEEYWLLMDKVGILLDQAASDWFG